MDEFGVLVVPAKLDQEREAVCQAWLNGGGSVLRLDRFWEPPADLGGYPITLYGPDTFCLVLAQLLKLNLLSPADDLLLTLPVPTLGRRVVLRPLGKMGDLDYPVFVKSVIPKQIRSRVYASHSELLLECNGLEAGCQLLVSPPVTIHAEAMVWMLADRVMGGSIYEGSGSLEQALALAETLNLGLNACVADLALLDSGWHLLEVNACWGAGLNGCSAEAVLPCIRAATLAGEQAR